VETFERFQLIKVCSLVAHLLLKTISMLDKHTKHDQKIVYNTHKDVTKPEGTLCKIQARLTCGKFNKGLNHTASPTRFLKPQREALDG
jgi:hypothetical protein